MSFGFSAGRRREAERLRALLSRVADEGMHLALIEGPRGVGKTALVDAFVTDARREGAIVVDVRVRHQEPFSPLDALVDQTMSILGQVPRGVELGCAHGCHPLWFHHPAPGPTDPERALEAHRVHLESFRRLLGELARLGPTVIVIRGLASASRDIVALLSHSLSVTAAGNASPRCLIIGIVEDGNGAELSALATHPRTIRIPLRGLDEEALRAMLARPEVVARILARTGGHPVSVSRLLTRELPTAEAHLAERLASVGPAAGAVFDALSVLAVPTAIVDLSRVAGAPIEPALIAHLERAFLVESQGDVVALADPDDGAKNLGNIDAAHRIALHERAAELYESRRRYGEAARHALAAGDRRLAAILVRRAATHLGAHQAHCEAAALLSEIRSGLDDEARAALDAPLADALLSAGEFGSAVAPARRVWESNVRDAASSRRLSRALVLAGHLDEAERVLHRAETSARAAGDAAAALALGATLAELRYQSGRLDEAEAHAARIVAAAEVRAEVRLDAHQTLAKVALARGHLAEAEARYRAYELAACEAGSAAHQALAIGGLGVALLTAGDVSAAERELVRCGHIGQRVSDRKAQSLAQHNLAVAAHLRHDYTAARERYEEAIRLLALVGNRTSLSRAAYNLGELYESLGAYDRALAMCDYGAQAGGPDIAPRAMAEGLLLRGRLALSRGDMDAAGVAFEAARDTLEALDPIRNAAALVGLGRVAIREGRVDEASTILDGITAGLHPSRRAELALARAELAHARGLDVVGAARRAVAEAEAADEERVVFESLVNLARVLFEHDRASDAQKALALAAELDDRLRARVPEDLLSNWEDRPTRRTMLMLLSSGRARQLGRRPQKNHDRLGIVGASEGICRVRQIIDRVGPSDCNVLLRGESGTGKELAARALHRVSARSRGPLVALNCAAIVESLLLSELFGHEKGAFTGAMGRQVGRFEQAHGGTLFLDEIGDISPAVQAALLRVLSERSFERVGGREAVRVDVRVIAATNRDLEAMVRDGTFREDLYYRLNEVSIGLPPLRDRRDDVPLLADHVLERIAAERAEAPKRLSHRAVTTMVRCEWPGNVRQLENALRAATLFADGDEVDESHLNLHGIAATMERPRAGLGAVPGDEVELCYERLKGGDITLRDLKKEIERELIERALSDSGWNISQAAELLGMKRPRLSQLVKEHGLRQTGGET